MRRLLTPWTVSLDGSPTSPASVDSSHTDHHHRHHYRRCSQGGPQGADDRFPRLVAGGFRPLRRILHPNGLAQRRHLPRNRWPRRCWNGEISPGHLFIVITHFLWIFPSSWNLGSIGRQNPAVHALQTGLLLDTPVTLSHIHSLPGLFYRLVANAETYRVNNDSLPSTPGPTMVTWTRPVG